MDRSQGVGTRRAGSDGAGGKHKGPPRRRRAISFMALEPRIMYDGAAAVTAAAAHHHHHDGARADASQAGAGPNAVAPGVSAPTPSGGDGHWHHEAAPTGPMPTVITWVKD